MPVQAISLKSYILLVLSVLMFFPKNFVFFVMSWCTSGVGLQVLPFIDNRQMGRTHRFQRFSCFCQFCFVTIFVFVYFLTIAIKLYFKKENVTKTTNRNWTVSLIMIKTILFKIITIYRKILNLCSINILKVNHCCPFLSTRDICLVTYRPSWLVLNKINLPSR